MNGQSVRAAFQRRALGGRLLLGLAAVAIVIYTAFPLYWLVTTSVKPASEVLTSPPVYVPSSVTGENYLNLLTNPDLLRAAGNSVLVAFVSTLSAMVIGTLAAYGLALSGFPRRFRFAFVVWILATRTFPPITTAIPYFVLISSIGLADTHIGLITTYVAFALPFVIWLMLGFFQDLPPEIDEAAIVDGASLWQRFFRVMVPLVRPATGVVFALVFISLWNEFLYASILTSTSAKTLPVLIAGYSSNVYLKWGEMSALGTLMVGPVLLIAAVAQKSLIRGLTFGAVKG